jgi:hypothetical protein
MMGQQGRMILSDVLEELLNRESMGGPSFHQPST